MAFSKIAFSSAVPSLAVAATAGASEGIIEGLADPLTANLGLYDSGDGGNTWRYATVTDNRREHSARVQPPQLFTTQERDSSSRRCAITASTLRAIASTGRAWLRSPALD